MESLRHLSHYHYHCVEPFDRNFNCPLKEMPVRSELADPGLGPHDLSLCDDQRNEFRTEAKNASGRVGAPPSLKSSLSCLPPLTTCHHMTYAPPSALLGYYSSSSLSRLSFVVSCSDSFVRSRSRKQRFTCSCHFLALARGCDDAEQLTSLGLTQTVF